MKIIVSVICLLFVVPWTALAQGCPSGIPSGGNPMCIPPNVEGSPYYSAPAAQEVLRSQWQLTWGAIATDSETGDVGVVVGEFSRSKAKRKAMSRCAADGARKCKVELAYKNQCAVIAWPSENGQPVGGGASVIQSGPSVAIATELALKACTAERGGRDTCTIIYSDCTIPVLVR